jgi:16S rRNA (uracil1498-N3)-methyltransferase
VIFEGKDAHYIERVLRLRRGEEIIVFSGEGTEYTATIGILSPRRVEAIVTAVARPAASRSFRLALAQAFLKGRDFEAAIRQSTEIGLSDIYPLVSSRCVGELKRWEKKEQRIASIIADACRQSGQSVLPLLHPPLSWNNLLSLAAEFDLCLLPWEGEREKSLKAALGAVGGSPPPRGILAAIGPEGGFTAEEAAGARAAGFVPVRLGPSILRAMTASPATLAMIHYHFQA